jgi:hypothetical protein
MKKPTIVEIFADNGEHSHYALIETETGELLWSEAPEEEIQQVNNLNKAAASNCSSLLSSLIEAKVIIRTWHGMNMNEEDEKKMWAIYEKNAPEMKRLNTAIDAAKKNCC